MTIHPTAIGNCIFITVPKLKLAEDGEYNLTASRYENDKLKIDNGKFEIVKLGNLCSLIRGVTYSKEDETKENGYKILRANNINLTGQINFDDVKRIRSDIKISNDKKLQRNDIFICLASGSKQHIGKVAFVENDMDCYFGGFMGAIRTNDKINPKYLFYLLRTDRFNNYLNKAISGVNINNLNAKILYDFSIPLPPLSIQKQIVAEIENKQQAIDNARRTIDILERERESILVRHLTA